MIEFTTNEVFDMGKRGTLHTTRCPRDLSHHGEFIGQEIILDGKVVVVRGMETFAKATPPRKGEPIGLLI